MIRDGVFCIGYVCVVTAAFMVAVPLGLVTLGGPLMALSLYRRKDQK